MIFVISGPSGVGKGTIISELLSIHPDWRCSVSATTRPPRPNEINGKDYYFFNQKKFESYIESNSFIEYCKVHHHYYGTLKSELNLNSTSAIIVEIDVNGAKKIKRQTTLPQFHLFIQPESIEQLKQQLADRATDSIEQINHRLTIATNEMMNANLYDKVVINKDLTQSIQSIDNILTNALMKGKP